MAILTGMTHAEAAGLWSGLLILLLGLLSIRATVFSSKRKGETNSDEDSQSSRASRVFSNAAEYIPISVGALILLYHLELPVMAIHGLGALLLAGRVVQAVGLSRSDNGSSALAGVALTFVAIFAGGSMLVFYAFL